MTLKTFKKFLFANILETERAMKIIRTPSCSSCRDASNVAWDNLLRPSLGHSEDLGTVLTKNHAMIQLTSNE